MAVNVKHPIEVSFFEKYAIKTTAVTTAVSLTLYKYTEQAVMVIYSSVTPAALQFHIHT